MATCDTCETRILFGGIKSGNYRYCSDACARNSVWRAAMEKVPDDELEREVRMVHQGNCPKCHGPGPVDIHVSHKVYSALAFTRWSSHPVIACRSCGRSRQIKHAVFSMFLGWWGFPFGLVITPAQVIRNLGGILGITGPSPETPSPALARAVRLSLAARKQVGAVPPGNKPAGNNS
ncbi:MAG: hypothetical protein ACP5XB_19080 [Isosphaeraceae bacterium]